MTFLTYKFENVFFMDLSSPRSPLERHPPSRIYSDPPRPQDKYMLVIFIARLFQKFLKNSIWVLNFDQRFSKFSQKISTDFVFLLYAGHCNAWLLTILKIRLQCNFLKNCFLIFLQILQRPGGGSCAPVPLLGQSEKVPQLSTVPIRKIFDKLLIFYHRDRLA